jgi:spermidine synthase
VVSARFAELDWRQTPMGELSLRRRLEPSLNVDVYEVRLGDEFLMSSLFTVAEVELARLALAELTGNDLDVIVGGLGLGYTARAALDDPRIRRLQVVEAQPAVIEWHQQQLLPLGAELTADPRCELVEADFFAAIDHSGFGPDAPALWHAIIVDIDHTPDHLLHPSHAKFYTTEGLQRLASHLHPGGVFALWSDDPPLDSFVTLLDATFAAVTAQVVTFANHYTDQPSANTVYVAQLAPT